jgi:hypothetical protein
MFYVSYAKKNIIEDIKHKFDVDTQNKIFYHAKWLIDNNQNIQIVKQYMVDIATRADKLYNKSKNCKKTPIPLLDTTRWLFNQNKITTIFF